MKRWLKIYYVEPEESAIIGSFVFDDIVMGDEPGGTEPKRPKSKKKKKERTQEKVASCDIELCLV